MVWVPDAIVSEYCTRDTEPDASNRARYHCNACAEVFPLGNVNQMHTHLIACPSLTTATIDSINQRIADELTSPKRVTRDPRWSKAEETKLIELDADLPSGKMDSKYTKMAAIVGRSAQACRQKLIHLKESKAAEEAEKETTEPMLSDESDQSDQSDQNTEPQMGRIQTRSSRKAAISKASISKTSTSETSTSKASINALLSETIADTSSPKTPTKTRSSKAITSTNSPKTPTKSRSSKASTNTLSPKITTKPQSSKTITKTQSLNSITRTRSLNVEAEPESTALFTPIQYKPLLTTKQPLPITKPARPGSRKVRFNQPETKMDSPRRSSRQASGQGKAAADDQVKPATRSQAKPATAATQPTPPTYAQTKAETRAQTKEAKITNSPPTITTTLAPARYVSSIPLSDKVDEFLRLSRWAIHQALTEYKVARRFYPSEIPLETGWDTFAASDIPAVEKDRVVARLIRLWLDELEVPGFQEAVDAKVERMIQELSEWPFEAGTRDLAAGIAMKKARKELTTEDEESVAAADAGVERMEL